jgi:transketolase
MTVINPADDTEARAAVEAAIQHDGPVYCRFGRLAVPVINDPATYKFELGKGVTLREGSDIAVIATGLLVNEALTAADALAKEGISVRVINIHTIKPLDEEIVLKAAAECGRIVTAEEHSIIGGLGSAVAECVCGGCPVPVTRIGVNDTFGHSGPAAELLKQFGLSAEHIAETVREVLKK